MAEDIAISQAPADQRWAALDLTFSTLLPQPAREQHIRSLLADSAAGDERWRGLWIARRQETIVGAVWAHFQPGQAVNVWPPRLAAGESGSVADRLLAGVLAEVETAEIKMAQALVAPADRDDIARLSAAGFTRLAELEYLVSGRAASRSGPPTLPLELEPYQAADRARMEAIVDRTYVGSLDCAGLNGLRTGSQLLDEYQSTAAHLPGHWFFATSQGTDVGCLLLADHPALDQFELVYVALVPEVRGRGWGAALVRYAQWFAATVGRQRMVLAVDSANRPAVAMYEALGMVAWDRRDVYLRTFASACLESAAE